MLHSFPASPQRTFLAKAVLSTAKLRLDDWRFDEDPELSAEEFGELKRQVMRRYGKRLDLGDVA